jgi:hypothetical protein
VSEKTQTNAHEFEEELQIPACFETGLLHSRRKRKQFTYEAHNKPVQSPKKKFKVYFYFATPAQQYSCIRLVLCLAFCIRFIVCRV